MRGAAMRVIFTVTGILKESAGTTYTVPALCSGLVRNGVEVQLHTLGAVREGRHEYPVFTYKRHRFPLWALGRSPEMLHGLLDVAQDCDIIHNNGIWMLPNVYPAIVKRNSRCKLVFCPHGGLSAVALKRSRLKKFMMGHFGGQYMALRATDMFHAASIKELEEIRALGYRQPVAMVPNGIDVPEISHKPFGGSKRKLVFLGRIHATKAVGNLVDAWGNVQSRFPEWSLEIAGPDCGDVSRIKEIISRREIPRVKFVGEFHGKGKYEFLAGADLYVLPSLTENFGITIAEALACGTPVIASRGCPWSRLGEKKCGWWIDVGADALTEMLETALSASPAALAEMGANGRRWMESEFSWDIMAKRMLASYSWLLGKGDKPEFVYVD